MELKELTREIMELFGCKRMESFPSAVREIVFSSTSSIVYDKYKELCSDLTVDWLQRIYQFYLADREGKKQDYTPVCLSKLVNAVTSTDEEETVYDCCCGSGSLTIQKWVSNPNLDFVLEELDENVIPILLFNLCIRNIEATVINKNVLSGEIKASYKIKRGIQYGTVEQSLFPETELLQADTAISNPPFNLSVAVNDEITKDMPEKYTCNFAFAEHCLQRSRRYAAIILPAGVLSSKKEIECRKSLIERGKIKAAIALPEKMFESTPVSTCILLLDKQKTSKDIMVVDARGACSKEIREQRGEGDASHYNRIYKKEFNTFTDEQIFAITKLLNVEQKDYSMFLTEEKLKEHEYIFDLGPYKPIEIEHTQHRDFNQIIKDINRIARERNVLKVTINKVWAEKLGLQDIIEKCKALKEVSEDINKQNKQITGYELENIIIPDYIRSSNSKVLVIENSDKEILSSILPFFMTMWAQHIYYLNDEEDRLLVELRDSMLPYLMDGTITVKD